MIYFKKKQRKAAGLEGTYIDQNNYAIVKSNNAN
jgi:hypothetical protein